MNIHIDIDRLKNLNEQLEICMKIANVMDVEQRIMCGCDFGMTVRPGSSLADVLEIYNLKAEIFNLKKHRAC